MTFALLHLAGQLRHRTTRRRLVEKLARRFTSRRHALEISRHIP